MMTFEELGLQSELLKAIQELGFQNPMPVQEAVLPILLNPSEQSDLVALAQTGTGKTAAFGLPILQRINVYDSITEALILSPTRELCVQIANDLTRFAKHLPGCTIVPVYGGANIETQKKALKKGSKIIVATPGRIIDLIKRGYVDLSHIKWAVLDEADEMLDMGFKEDLDTILSETPQEKQTLLFSATMPKEVERIAHSYMHDPINITIGERNTGNQNVKHHFYIVQAKDRYLALKRIVDYYPGIYAIIFCRTRSETQEVATQLMQEGYNADALHGDLSQTQRDYVMERFRCRNLQLLVATDVAARGLDVRNLSHVINYNLPDEPEQYTHRSGRTGRADKTGISISIINLREKGKIRRIQEVVKQDFEQHPVPTGMDVCKKQFFHLLNKVQNVEVRYDEITTYIESAVKQLDWMDKEELIRRFVSIEFNRFLDYYKDSPDLNKQLEEPKKKKDPNAPKPVYDDKDLVTLEINLGYDVRIVPNRLIALINDRMGKKKPKIGKIDINQHYTHIDIEALYAEDVIDEISALTYHGKPLTAEIVDKSQAPNSVNAKEKRKDIKGKENKKRNEKNFPRKEKNKDSFKQNEKRVKDFEKESRSKKKTANTEKERTHTPKTPQEKEERRRQKKSRDNYRGRSKREKWHDVEM